MKVIILKCKKCGHEWIRRLNFNPKECPKCKNRNWNKDIGKPNENSELPKRSLQETKK